ncbi:MAG: stage II sporulation protein D [Acutalibacteraceae bacterium]
MRTNLIICIIIALSMILCPIAALGGEKSGENREKPTELSTQVPETAESADKPEKYISVLSQSSGSVAKVKMREYVIGSVAAEMSPLYHTEALKAQAVASYTYAKKTKEQNEKHKDSSLGDADITDSPAIHQGYISKSDRKKKWGDNYEEYEKKIEAAVDEVFGCYVTYNGETALTVYHSISAGATQSAEALWGTDIPYLISVESPGDKLSPDYRSEKSFSESEFKNLIEKCSVTLTGNAEKWVGEAKKDETGYVSSQMLGSTSVSGVTIRDALGLRSLCFDIKYSESKFTVVCLGYGHGIGMSQYGADYMARQGSSWQEILMHYYSGADIVNE